MDIRKLFRSQIADIEKKNEYLKEGKPLYIPLSDSFKRLKRYIAGLVPSSNIIVTASSGIGKSRFCKKMFITDPIDFARKNPHINLNIFINTLEESPEELITSFVLSRLSDVYGIIMTHNEFNLYQTTPMEQSKLDAIKSCIEYIDDLAQYLIIIQESNNFGAYKRIREWCRGVGTFYKADGTALSIPKTGEFNFRNTKFTRWQHDVENSFNILITDRVGLMYPEKGKTLFTSVGEWSAKWCRSLLNLRYGFITVNIQQTKSAAEELDTTYKGDLIQEKLVPSISSLSVNKGTNMDATIILALFKPSRYRIEKFYDYDVTKLKGYFITVHLLKSRNSAADLIFPMFANLATNEWRDLPKASDKTKMNKVYNLIQKLKQ